MPNNLDLDLADLIEMVGRGIESHYFQLRGIAHERGVGDFEKAMLEEAADSLRAAKEKLNLIVFDARSTHAELIRPGSVRLLSSGEGWALYGTRTTGERKLLKMFGPDRPEVDRLSDEEMAERYGFQLE